MPYFRGTRTCLRHGHESLAIGGQCDRTGGLCNPTLTHLLRPNGPCVFILRHFAQGVFHIEIASGALLQAAAITSRDFPERRVWMATQRTRMEGGTPKYAPRSKHRNMNIPNM